MEKKGSFLRLIQLDLISRALALCLAEIAPAGRSLIQLLHQTLQALNGFLRCQFRVVAGILSARAVKRVL